MNFKSISNNRLINELKLRVENERKLLMEVLHALREVEIRKLHLEMGYPDLYEFAMKELGYSSGAAYRRISAMRLLQSVPEVAPKLASGELGLENASQVQSFFRKEDRRRKDTGEHKLSLMEKREVISDLIGKSTREGQRVLMEHSPETMVPTEKLRPLPEQKTLVQFVASAELMTKLEELKHLLAHQNYEGRIDVLIENLADLALKRLKPAQIKSQSKSQAQVHFQSPSPSPVPMPSRSPAPRIHVPIQKSETLAGSRDIKKPSRYIPRAVRRNVLLKKQDGCAYRDPKTGKTCASQHGLQFDHIQPFSRGGQNSAENLRLLCGAHNRYRAVQMGLWN